MVITNLNRISCWTA